MNYYISDLHLFTKFNLNTGKSSDNRPYSSLEEMHNDIKEKWNNKITNADKVYILGDIYRRGYNDELVSFFANLKGQKILIKGNHDDLSDIRYKQLFSEIYDNKELDDYYNGKTLKLVLSHYPILMWNGQHRGAILLYGHTHNTVEDEFFQKCIAEMNADNTIRHEGDPEFLAINVGCMKNYIDYLPRSLKEILDSLSKS